MCQLPATVALFPGLEKQEPEQQKKCRGDESIVVSEDVGVGERVEMDEQVVDGVLGQSHGAAISVYIMDGAGTVGDGEEESW